MTDISRVCPEPWMLSAHTISRPVAQMQSASTPKEQTSALAQISQAAAEMAAVCDVAHSLAEQETMEKIL